jgi:MFS family permease
MKTPALKTVFRALGYRNFRLFFVGQGISLVGTWMQQIAMSWLVYRLTGSAFMLGVVSFASQIPTFLLSPFAGVLADRWDRRRILIVTQVLSMAQAFMLAILTLSGNIAVWHIIALGIGLGCINSLDFPSRHSFIIEMVEGKEMLGNAIALNSLLFNMARLVGPSIAGILIAVIGEGLCFFINGVSYLAVIVSLALMKMGNRKKKIAKSDVLKGFIEGVRYTFGFSPIKHILVLLSIVSAMGMSYVILLPVFVKDVLHGGPAMLGFLMASVGVGASIATVFLASREKVLKLGRIIPISASAFAIGIVLFSLSHVLWLSLLLLAFSGFGFMVHMAASNIILQTIVEDDKRGRVMSFYTMAFMGMAPIGSLLAGTLASWLGVTNTLVIGGFVCIAGALIFAARIPRLKVMVRPIYEKASLRS